MHKVPSRCSMTCSTTAPSGDKADGAVADQADCSESEQDEVSKREVYGDASYGTADIVERLESADIEPYVKVQPPSGRDGKFAQDKFEIDLKAGVVCCPAYRWSNFVSKKTAGQEPSSAHSAANAHCATHAHRQRMDERSTCTRSMKHCIESDSNRPTLSGRIPIARPVRRLSANWPT